MFFVSTPSHGGFKLEAKHNVLIPAPFCRDGGWYEEDCDVPISSGGPTGLCPRCYLPDTRGDQTQTPPGRSSSGGEARRKLTLASAFAAIGAIVSGVLWLGNRRAQ
jgi:hypothetical protein